MKAKKEIEITIEELSFLLQSNYIEREFSELAFTDAKLAWQFAKSKSNKRMTIKYITDIHKLLIYNVNYRIAGKLRNVDVWVSGKDINHKYLSPLLIRRHLKLWLQEFRNVASEDAIKRSHIAFEMIHPFEDGNGRVGRILMNIMRLNVGLPILIIHAGKEQTKYYEWFRGDEKIWI